MIDAGWQVAVGKFFAMGSGPMRAAHAKEDVFAHIPGRESPPVAVGVLETRKAPNDDVVAYLCERLKLPADRLTLAFAPADAPGFIAAQVIGAVIAVLVAAALDAGRSSRPPT